jgi:hypothetical protein
VSGEDGRNIKKKKIPKKILKKKNQPMVEKKIMWSEHFQKESIQKSKPKI